MATVATRSVADLKSAWRQSIAVVPRVFAFLWEVSPGLFVTLASILLFNAFAPAALAWLTMKVIVDGVVEAATTGSGWLALSVPLGAVFAIWMINACPPWT